MTSLLFLTQKKPCKSQSIYYITYLKNIIWKLPQKDGCICFRWGGSTENKNYYKWWNSRTSSVISLILGCSISCQFYNDVEFKLANFLQLIVAIKRNIFNLLDSELFFLVLAHPVYKRRIIQEPNTIELWNKLHFEDEKTEIIQHISNIRYLYLLNKYIKCE